MMVDIVSIIIAGVVRGDASWAMIAGHGWSMIWVSWSTVLMHDGNG